MPIMLLLWLYKLQETKAAEVPAAAAPAATERAPSAPPPTEEEIDIDLNDP